MPQTKTLLLVDGSSYLYRAFHALPDFTSPKGQPTGAIYGVLNMLQKLIKEEQSDLVGIIFDAPGKTFRHDLFPEYKANRQKTPDDLISQIKPLHQAIKSLGLPLIIESGVEADDVMGTLAREAEAKNIKTIIATGDKDMAQLVSNHITLVDTMKNTRMNREAVIEKFGLPPELFIDYLALAGDASDNIPGVEKVGPKTAVKWITDYKSIDGLINNLDQVKGKVGDNLRAALPHLELYQKLVTIDCTLALDQKVEDLVIQPSNDDELYEQFKDLGLHGLIKQFNIEPKQNLIRDGVDYQVVLSEKELTHLIDRISLADIVAVDTETTSLNYMEAQIVGISIAIEPNQAFYIPCMHDYDNAPKQLPRDYVLQQLKPWLEDSNTKKVGHNLKYDSHIFKNHNIDIQGVMFDTMLQSYVLNSTATRHNLNAVSKRYLNLNTVSYEDVAGKGAKEILFSQVDLKKATYYAAEDADISLQLNHKIYPQLEEHRSLLSIYNNIEAPALQVLQRVERNGVLIDKDLLGEQSEEFAITLKELENKVHSVAKTEFNLGSPKQLQEILFEKMGLPILRKTPKGQPSTAENVLQQLAYDYPIVKDILDYRTIAKLKTTYTDKLPLMINPRTGRVHTSYHQAVTATGRLSSSDPNLQNIPIRRAEGKRIREAFVVSEGYQMMAADYSQIELRIMAHISQDEGLLNAFSQGLDIHQATAAEIFNLSIEDVKQDHRRSAKAINFGLIYGMSAFGLSNQLSISRKEAEEYIRLYFSRYPKVKDYMDNTRLRTKETGYVETVLGRRLYLPDINASNYQRRQYAERSAINAPMQGTAADLIKMAMINLQKHIDNENLDAKIIMQVHDELVLEVRQDIVDSLKETINHIMSSVADLDVELKVDVGLGDNWQEAH